MLGHQSSGIPWSTAMAVAIALGLASAGAAGAKPHKVDICHVNGQGEFHIITIAEPAYEAHIAHGDKDVETFYIDADGDGLGTTAMTVEDCTVPEGFADNPDDCDDTDLEIGLPSELFVDGDGFGDPATGQIACSALGLVADNTDCDDTDAAVHPEADKVFGNGIDDDCDESTPDTLPEPEFTTVFVTSQTYTGNLGGREGANAKC